MDSVAVLLEKLICYLHTGFYSSPTSLGWGPSKCVLSGTMCISLSTRRFSQHINALLLLLFLEILVLDSTSPSTWFFFSTFALFLQQTSFKKWCFSMFLPTSLPVFFLELIPSKIFSHWSQLKLVLSIAHQLHAIKYNDQFSFLDPGLLPITVMPSMITAE